MRYITCKRNNEYINFDKIAMFRIRYRSGIWEVRVHTSLPDSVVEQTDTGMIFDIFETAEEAEMCIKKIIGWDNGK